MKKIFHENDIRRFFASLRMTSKCQYLFLFLLLSGCSLFSPAKVDQTQYEINTIPAVAKRSTHPINLLISPVEANPIYATDQMIYVIKPHQINSFAKNRWTQPPAIMLQPLIIQTLQNTRYFRVVNSYPSTTSYDYILIVQLLELQQNFLLYKNDVSLKLRAQIIDIKNNRTAATREITVISPAPYASPYGGVIAANNAVSEALAQLTRFCIKHIYQVPQ